MLDRRTVRQHSGLLATGALRVPASPAAFVAPVRRNAIHGPKHAAVRDQVREGRLSGGRDWAKQRQRCLELDMPPPPMVRLLLSQETFRTSRAGLEWQ
jgi:hypothetical protein